jgi:hypothetical protein
LSLPGRWIARFGLSKGLIKALKKKRSLGAVLVPWREYKDSSQLADLFKWFHSSSATIARDIKGKQSWSIVGLERRRVALNETII